MAKVACVRRLFLVLAVGVVWVGTFLVVWRATDITPRPCNDLFLNGVAAACAAPGRSILPALPVATAAAVAVVVGAGLVSRRRADRESEPRVPIGQT